MNAIFKITRRTALLRSPTIAALAVARRSPLFAIPVSAGARYVISVAAIIAAILAAIAYVVAVNVMLLAGETMKHDGRILNALLQERSALSSALGSRESPRRIEADARAHGMVEAIGVRFLSPTDTVALSR